MFKAIGKFFARLFSKTPEVAPVPKVVPVAAPVVRPAAPIVEATPVTSTPVPVVPKAVTITATPAPVIEIKPAEIQPTLVQVAAAPAVVAQPKRTQGASFDPVTGKWTEHGKVGIDKLPSGAIYMGKNRYGLASASQQQVYLTAMALWASRADDVKLALILSRLTEPGMFDVAKYPDLHALVCSWLTSKAIPDKAK